MGNPAEKVTIKEENLSPEEIAAAETKAKEETDAKAEAETKAAAEKAEQAEADKAKAETDKRTELEAEGKTPEEIDEAIKAMSVEPTEFEIVRSGTQPDEKLITQEQLNKSVKSRVKKLNKKVDRITEQSAETAGKLEIVEQKNKLLTIALEQTQGKGGDKVQAPNPDDFDQGKDDVEFIKKQGEYNAHLISEEVAKQVAAHTQTATADTGQIQKAEALERKQTKHYERAAEIGAKDYEETEDKALEILGNDVANHMIDNFEDSHILLYFLGKNPDEAQRISDLVESGKIGKVFAELGRLSSELKIQPKGGTAPDPDEELNSDATPTQSGLERKLQQLRDEAGRTGKMEDLMAFKKKHNL